MERQAMSRRSAGFKRVLRQALKEAGDLPVAARERIRADFQLQIDFPGQYVGYIDTWPMHNHVRHFSRQIVAHAPSLADLEIQLAELAPRLRSIVYIDYIIEPDGPLQVHYDLPGR